MQQSGLDTSSPRLPTKDIIDKTCPSPYDVKDGREFLLSLGPNSYSAISDYSLGLEKVVRWLQVNCLYPMQKKLTFNARQENPDTPPELIIRYQVVVNVLRHYSYPLHRRPAIRNDRYFFKNVHKAPGFSIIDSWTYVKKLLNRRT